jgi:threonine synthase
MATKTKLQRLAMQAANRAKAAAAVATREANRLLKEARRRVTDERTHRKIKQSLLKTGRVLKAASAAAAAAARAEMTKGSRSATRRRRR